MKKIRHLTLLLVLCLGIGIRAQAAEEPLRKWDGLLEVTYKFSWYPRADLQKLLEVKSAEFGQSLEQYRDGLLTEVTGGRAPTARIRPGDFVTGLPWRDYYLLSMAEFASFLATEQELHLSNAQAVLSVLAQKDEQPEIELWNYVFRAHRACLARDRDDFIAAVFNLWQNVVLRFELEALYQPAGAPPAGFGRNLPFLYENVAHLVLRKAILDREIAELYPLSPLILDIRPKLTIENGYKTLVDQVAERMQGADSDNRNLNFATALLEATARRYDFEDEKDETLLKAKYNLAHKYYQLAYDWADTGQGKAAVLVQHMGFMNYIVRRLTDPSDALAASRYFQSMPYLASHRLELVYPFIDQLAAPEVRNRGGAAQGFEDREAYLQAMHQLWDATAKLAIVVSGFYKSTRATAEGAEILPAARPLELYCDMFERYARQNDEILPDDAYFLAAYAARELGGLYRDQARFSTDNRADELAFAYQMQAAEIFPLDLPCILQMAFQCSRTGQVQKYFQYSGPLASRLRVSTGASAWSADSPGDFRGMVALVPTVVPKVVNNAFVLIEHFPQEETSEDVLFARAVAMAKLLGSGEEGRRPDQVEGELSAIGRGETSGEAAAYPYYQLKSELYGAPDSPVHGYLRTLYNEIPYENHAYVALLQLRR